MSGKDKTDPDSFLPKNGGRKGPQPSWCKFDPPQPATRTNFSNHGQDEPSAGFAPFGCTTATTSTSAIAPAPTGFSTAAFETQQRQEEVQPPSAATSVVVPGAAARPTSATTSGATFSNSMSFQNRTG
ncbi:unnamed protein product, partial [Amoebophrya sp. A120]|eukprot:GSA120T00019798001.1